MRRFQQNIDNTKTEIILVLDRSGSMKRIKESMEESLNAFLEDQKSTPGLCLVTLIQFDDKYECVFNTQSIHDLPVIRIIPRGGTALYDALGRTIVETSDRITNLSVSDKPDKVIVITITDGEENVSRKFNKDAIIKLISQHEEQYSWRFYYLGTNQDAFKVAKDIGIKNENALTYSTTKGGMRAMTKSLSYDVSRQRTNTSRPLDALGKPLTMQALYQQNLDDEDDEK